MEVEVEVKKEEVVAETLVPDSLGVSKFSDDKQPDPLKIVKSPPKPNKVQYTDLRHPVILKADQNR